MRDSRRPVIRAPTGWAIRFGTTTDTHCADGFGTLKLVALALEMFRESAGNAAAFDYRFYVKSLNLNLGDAAQEIITSSSDDDANLQRVEAMRQYAATVAK